MNDDLAIARAKLAEALDRARRAANPAQQQQWVELAAGWRSMVEAAEDLERRRKGNQPHPSP